MVERKKHSGKRWAEFRFAVIGPLLASPPETGSLYATLGKLAEKEWIHPIHGKPFMLSTPTLERWYYRAKNEKRDIVSSLLPKKRSDTGEQDALPDHWKTWLAESYGRHRRWTWQLHSDELAARIRKEEPHAKPPSYSTVRRYMKSRGLFRIRQCRNAEREGAQKVRSATDLRETRSYEVEYVGGLWHTDFHHARRRVLLENGEWVTPIACAFIDDRARLCCHLQWFAEESAQALVHSLCQAIQKRGVPRAVMTDNGGPMATPEFREGLMRLAIVHDLTRPYSPQQNAKVEVFWGILEGRLMAMLEKVSSLTLIELNRHSQAWVEAEYNRKIHRETKVTPYDRFLNDKSVLRPAPTQAC